MKIHIPERGKRDKDGESFTCFDHLSVDRQYSFFGHIIDMSLRRDDDESIPEKPFITTRQMTQEDLVTLGMNDHSDKYIPNQDFYICRAAEFKKLPGNIETSAKNNAIVLFLKALDPEWYVIIEMSW